MKPQAQNGKTFCIINTGVTKPKPFSNNDLNVVLIPKTKQLHENNECTCTNNIFDTYHFLPRRKIHEFQNLKFVPMQSRKAKEAEILNETASKIIKEAREEVKRLRLEQEHWNNRISHLELEYLQFASRKYHGDHESDEGYLLVSAMKHPVLYRRFSIGNGVS